MSKPARFSKELLEELYLEKQMGTGEIAKILGTTPGNVWSYLKTYRIPRREQPKVNDLSGRRFGLLTVVSRVEVAGKGRDLTFWKCVCDCGGEVVLERRELVRKDSRSRKTCGCRGYTGVIPGWYWSRFPVVTHRREGEKFRNFTIDYAYMCELFEHQNGRCAISGVSIQFSPNKKQQSELTTASIDRIDSSIGYVKGNVQFVHKVVNTIKNKFSHADFVLWCHTIMQFQETGTPVDVPGLVQRVFEATEESRLKMSETAKKRHRSGGRWRSPECGSSSGK